MSEEQRLCFGRFVDKFFTHIVKNYEYTIPTIQNYLRTFNKTNINMHKTAIWGHLVLIGHILVDFSKKHRIFGKRE